jgi:hypothetical protein
MKSPFSEGRFEHEASHIYYLPTSCFPQLEQPHPTYLIGSRGSGKTTLMKALHWKERLDNPTLVRQLGGTPFRDAFVGNYVKLPTIQLKSFDAWLESEDETNYGLVFGLYLDLTCVELIAHATGELLARQSLKIPAIAEGPAVEGWLDDYQEFQHFRGAESPRSVSQFRARIRQIRRALEQHALLRMPLQSTFQEFPIDQIGSFACNLAKKMADFCERDESPREQPWHFKVCMDEGESLNGIQQRVINTIIRLSEWPLFHVVSYVSRPEDMTTTLAPQLTQQKADRQVIILDDFERTEFRELAEGVATARCQEALRDPSFAFDTQRVLGSLSINRLLKTILERSENPRAKQLLEQAIQVASAVSAAAEPPIAEAYLAEQLELDAPADTRSEQRRVESTQYRKKMVGAYLSICRELNVRNIPYASADAAFRISDNCVRDFLSQLDHLFTESGLELPDFVAGELDWDVQARALRAASLEKRDSIPESGILSPVETGRVVKGLARITASIQSWSDDKRHLRSTERGLFQLSYKASEADDLKRALALIQDAADAGFLRVKKEGGQIMHFRVHASLAPAYGFSYRGAYYSVTLSLADFKALKSADSNTRLEQVADAIAEKLSKQPPQEPEMPLFEGKQV